MPGPDQNTLQNGEINKLQIASIASNGKYTGWARVLLGSANVPPNTITEL